MNRTKNHLSALVAAATLSTALPATASNWLMLQGTEPAGSAARARVWGFVQPEFQYTEGTELKAGPFAGSDAQFNVIPPNLDTNSQFNIRRARLGVRGTGFPLDSKVNYFLLVEAGNNGITKPGGGTGSLKVTDASITLNHFKGARIRIGQFKYPGSEEGLQAIHVFDYINFTNFSQQELLERYFNYDGSNPDQANAPRQPVGAFRDIGVQVFDSFKQADWEHSYAVMIGNGNGITQSDNNSDKDYYLYWSSEKIFGGKGARRQGWKLYGWYQKGTRTLTLQQGNTDPTDDVTKDFDRKRWGLGTTFRKDPYRASAEVMWADGMIQNGTDAGAAVGTTSGTRIAGFNMAPDEKADGWYVDFGYKVRPNIELDARFDRLNRATETSTGERRFQTVTLGAQYFFNKKTRVTFNYEFREAEAPGLPSSHPANQILDGMDDRASVQLLAIF